MNPFKMAKVVLHHAKVAKFSQIWSLLGSIEKLEPSVGCNKDIIRDYVFIIYLIFPIGTGKCSMIETGTGGRTYSEHSCFI